MTGATPEVRTCYCGTTATVVPGVFPHPDCDGSAAAVTPGQAAYEAHRTVVAVSLGLNLDGPDDFDGPPGAWDALAPSGRSAWEAAAQAAIAVAEVPSLVISMATEMSEDEERELREKFKAAITAQQPQPAPELQAVESVYLYHWRFDRGEEFGLYRRRADADAMAAKHAGEGLSEVLGMAILGRPERRHIGRSWEGHDTEDDCPCPKAPCGLVVQETASEACGQHPLSARRTIRQSHRAGDCPAAPADSAPKPAPEASELRAVIDMIWRICQNPRQAAGTSRGLVVNGEHLAERITGLIKNSGMEPF